jgi:hypothetical protein
VAPTPARRVAFTGSGGPAPASIGRSHNAVHLAWRADARGMALDWWIEELEKPAVRAALLA